jgi:hypothetical protein
MPLPQIPQDKANHFVYGATISALFSRTTGNRAVGLVAAVVFAFGKEVWDLATKKGTPDIMDVVWTVLGGLCPWVAGGGDPLL